MDNKQDKINKMLISFLGLIIIILLGIILISAYSNSQNTNVDTEAKVYKVRVYTGSESNKNSVRGVVDNYSEYLDLLNELETNEDYLKIKMENNFHDNKKFVYYGSQINPCNEEVIYNSYKMENKVMTINFDVNQICGSCSPEYILFFIEVDKDMEIDEIKEDFTYTRDENCNLDIEKKPILYLYPKEETNVSVKLKNSDRIITSYPKYNDGWNVIAKTNGDLHDDNNKYYYALYWDEINTNKVDFSEGFYVSKDNAINFLEEKLEIIGLNAKERNEFIMYWLPILEKNNHNLIYFELTEEREKNNALIIEPKPDSLLRVNMHVKKVDKKTNIKEQELTTFKRNGFVAVEWGGTIYE